MRGYDHRLIEAIESGRPAIYIAEDFGYNKEVVKRLRVRLEEAKHVAMAELACLYPTAYNDLIDRFMGLPVPRERAARVRLGVSGKAAPIPSPVLSD